MSEMSPPKMGTYVPDEFLILITTESFTLSDLNVDDEVIQSLMEKDLSKMDESYKMKK